MTLNGMELSGPLRVTKVLRNGKRRFDPVEKERLIDAALEPGVSVAGLALAHGINANQLRNWIRLRQRRQTENALTTIAIDVPPAFVPVVEAADCAVAGPVGSIDITTGAVKGVATERRAA